MTTERAELVEPLPVEEEAATIALLATSEEREEGWTEEEAAEEVTASREESTRRSDALWAGDTRRALYGMAAAARRLNAAIEADQAYLDMLAAEIEQKNGPKRQQAAWLMEQVMEHAEELLPTGKRAGKFVDLPGVCRVQYVDRKRTVRLADAGLFIKWAEANGHDDLIFVVEQVRVADAKEEALSVLETSGELLPGVEDVPGRRTASIRWEGAS